MYLRLKAGHHFLNGFLEEVQHLLMPAKSLVESDRGRNDWVDHLQLAELNIPSWMSWKFVKESLLD